MANSYVDYTGDGSTRQFTVTFPYIARTHVAVKVNDEAATFSWVNNTLINLSAIPAAGATIHIYRTTPTDQRLVDFARGGRLSESDLDLMNQQLFYALQEDLEVDYIAFFEEVLAAKSDVGHGHVIDDVTGLQAALDGKSGVDHEHNDLYAVIGHNHDSIYAAIVHNHNTLYSQLDHTHDDRYFTEAEITTALAGKSDTTHTHDDRYFTETEVTTALAGKSDTTHTHDDRYFTEGEVTAALGGKADTTHTHTENQITDLSHDAQKIKGIDVDLTGMADGQILKYIQAQNKFLPRDDNTDEGAVDITLDTAPVLGGNLDMGVYSIQTVTPTEMPYLHGVTSPIQTQLNTKPTISDATIAVTVGTGGDYATLNAAITALTKLYPVPGCQATITLKTGFDLAEQLIIVGQDLSWIVIASEDDEVDVERSALTTKFSGAYPIMAFERACSPVINVLFKMDTSGTATGKHGLVARQSIVHIRANKGFKNCGGYGMYQAGGITYIGSGVLTGNMAAGALVDGGIFFGAYGTFSGNSAYGIYCAHVAFADLHNANCRTGEADDPNDIVVYSGSWIAAEAATGGLSQTKNVLTKDGVICKP